MVIWVQREKGQDDYAFLHAIFNLKNYGIVSVFFFFLLLQIVFMVFTPSLMFANLAKTVTLQDIISW